MITLPLSERKQHMTELRKALLDEQLLCFPTDSLYGLGGIVTPGVISRIDACKARLPGKYYSVIAPDRSWIETQFILPPNLYQQRPKRYTLHGPLTLLLTKKDPHWRSFVSPTSQVGVRWLPHHPIQGCIQALGQPLLATSCNRSGFPPITTPQELQNDTMLHASIAYFLTHGTCPGPASTLIDPNFPQQRIKRS